jgi:DNA processing protein
MDKDELWFILLELSNEKKLKLLIKYKSIRYIKNNKDNIIELSNITKDFNEEEIVEFDEYMKKNGIKYITVSSEEYPKTLISAYNPPFALFYIGNLDLLKNKLIAVIGARNCTQYGVEAAKIIGKELSSNDVTVVSGMALGIDSVAQNSAIDGNGRTIAVLGCGVDVIYPKANRSLYNKIVKDGLVLSEYLPKTTPKPYYFPMRNRIISGISEGIVVVEATSKSGSLITVDYALAQNKPVMAVPGSIFQRNSGGCNKLLRDGAHMLSDLDDLRLLFKIKGYENQESKINNSKNVLLKAISDEPKHLDDLLETVNVDRKVIFELLFEMQKRNEIICLPGNYYAKSL